MIEKTKSNIQISCQILVQRMDADVAFFSTEEAGWNIWPKFAGLMDFIVPNAVMTKYGLQKGNCTDVNFVIFLRPLFYNPINIFWKEKPLCRQHTLQASTV